jgi:RHH-type proline utilization regulon transcriptional repressor/proline dehydrogenase/delta 1-pyrroline-5-carboxylate dehydrogenase
LKVGNPMSIQTDVGPVINAQALAQLESHFNDICSEGQLLTQAVMSESIRQNGHYMLPSLVEISHMSQIKQEVFGPILHVIRYKSQNIDKVIQQINQARYGLTLGIHSRIESRALSLAKQIRVGNVYLNRNMIGSVVESQPFGGQGLSGTGPKSGGPYYLYRFATEKVMCRNLTVTGGNPQLLSAMGRG